MRPKKQFNEVLEREPDNRQALASLASLSFNQQRFDEATNWYKKVIEVQPDNKEAFYTLGVIAWNTANEPIQKARQSLGMKPDDPGPIRNEEKRQELRLKYLSILEEGLVNLNAALTIDAGYDDAMAYLNLLYRAKAELEESQDIYQEDMQRADA